MGKTVARVAEEQERNIGRGKNPASIRALSRQGQGRPSVPKEQLRTSRTFLLQNVAWNGLVSLAESEALSVSRTIEQIAERAGWLLEPPVDWISPERLAQMRLTEMQARALPLLTVLRLSFEPPRPSRQKRQVKAPKLDSAGRERHSITLSPAGWEGLKLLALSLKMTEAETLDLLGQRVAVLERPLSFWLQKPTQSLLQQIVAIPI